MATYLFYVTAGSATAVGDLGMIPVGIVVTGDISDRIPTTAANLKYQIPTYDASGRAFIVGSVRASASYGAGASHGVLSYAVATTNPPVLGDSRFYPPFLDLAGNLRITATAVWPITGTANVISSAITATIASGTVTLASGSIAAITSNAGAPVGITVSTATGASIVTVLGANTARKAVMICNDGSGVLYLGRSTTVQTTGGNKGIPVYPSGSFSDSGWGLYTGIYYGVYTITASANVAVAELT